MQFNHSSPLSPSGVWGLLFTQIPKCNLIVLSTFGFWELGIWDLEFETWNFLISISPSLSSENNPVVPSVPIYGV